MHQMSNSKIALKTYLQLAKYGDAGTFNFPVPLNIKRNNAIVCQKTYNIISVK